MSKKIIKKIFRVGLIIVIAGSILFTSLFLLLAYSPVGNFFENRLSLAINVPGEVEAADYIVVLGGNVQRVIDALRLYELNLAPAIILSGGREDHISTLHLFGIPESVILHDELATCTADHPLTIAKLPGVDRTSSVILVTSGHHPWRARRIFIKAGYRDLQMFVYKPPDSRDRIGADPRGAIGIFYELAAIIKDKLHGNL